MNGCELFATLRLRTKAAWLGATAFGPAVKGALCWTVVDDCDAVISVLPGSPKFVQDICNFQL